jgi:hypothetical protein
MAVLHVYTLGSNTAPYATKATGSTTLATTPKKKGTHF